MALLLLISILAVIFGACSALIYRYFGAVRVSESDLKWFEDFSLERYRPMERLLAGSDHNYYRAELSRAIGSGRTILIGRLSPSPESQNPGQSFQCFAFRSTRRRLFREYLRNLIRDFKRLQAIAGSQLPILQTIDPQISLNLVKLRFSFAFACALIEVQLAVDVVRLRPIEVWPLLEYLNGITAQLRWCAPGLQSQVL